MRGHNIFFYGKVQTIIPKLSLLPPFYLEHCLSKVLFYISDPAWVQNVYINLPAVKRRAEVLGTRRTVKKQWQVCQDKLIEIDFFLRGDGRVNKIFYANDYVKSAEIKLCGNLFHQIWSS